VALDGTLGPLEAGAGSLAPEQLPRDTVTGTASEPEDRSSPTNVPAAAAGITRRIAALRRT
jgi:hypothetical protein